MNLAPILVMDTILFVITVSLAVAARLLVNYGTCKITVSQEDEENEFAVEGGGFLLSGLVDNQINISSSCAGKASCGYCKVQVVSGGGTILPTEEVFMSREEKQSGMRLACQVKVKNDIKVIIPDFLTTVRGIVKNKTYDAKLKWRFRSKARPEAPPEDIKPKLLPEDREKAESVVGVFRGKTSSLVPALQGIHETFNYLPEPVLTYVSEQLEIPLSTVFRVGTFYNAFSFKPRGRYVITVCLGTACHVKGAGNVVSIIERDLGIVNGETTEDMLFTLQGARCIGCCGLAPVLTVNQDVHGLMSQKKMIKLLETYREAEKNAEA